MAEWEDIAAPAVMAGASFFGNERTNASNAKMAARQMAFQERMSSTAWTRGVADMRRAGLNPALAYQKGGADSPGGAMATMEDSVGKGVSSARETAALRSQLESDRVQRDAVAAQADKTRSETASIELMRQATLKELLARTGLHVTTGRTAEEQGKRIRNLLPFEQTALAAGAERDFASAETTHYQRQMMAEQMKLMGASAAQIRQAIKIADRMTPDAWAAYYQKNIGPLISSAGDLAGMLRDLGIAVGAARGLPSTPALPPPNRIGF